MYIESYLKHRDFALFIAEVTIKDNTYTKVDILEIQHYWGETVDLECLFEFDILPDVKRGELKDGFYYCQLLVSHGNFEGAEVEIIDVKFDYTLSLEEVKTNEEQAKIELPFK